ncbi:leucyl/phenylalanyl-tRNA--protein transferase [Hyphomonas neptunium ATCC 15444]|uniref:Leucyl/phenylalanyl-tRNA--protein transferase n=2 Tax=Hyphomonas TaxID=85 RepID=LFTR_HYPNA|nr:leucyl/phenylalanyl-tRNA--protein transferase [Hyphomonas neptunium]Q0BZZ7.1 RecName: Full=Leucyl/phenylalanyl-tRNA--protein transferase; AltName: Full=L/F-transferase; AltName: Full=Leucyltransferase; AltName: Full=Phenyalanyltransferase [Hyphomonas neptunium ATCC 15444]ABI75713.1 leucyl/phenylalanyl-tRNA--protein transferase [Hyphomonas neptunium ATCC 15444]
MSARFGPEDLLACYRRGVFPMADSRDDPRLFLVDPDFRGILPLDAFHIPKRLKRRVCQDPYRVSFDTAFTRVVEACGEPHDNRPNTWINSPIVNLYSALHRQGFAHSVECWDGDQLVGGLYGVSLGGAFFGESMFSRATDASKIALVHLAARLIDRGYVLLDAQFHNPHLTQFGLIEISRDAFKARLKAALKVGADFHGGSDGPAPDQSIGMSSSGGVSDSVTPAGMSSYSGSSLSGMIARSGSFTGSGAVQRITQMS